MLSIALLELPSWKEKVRVASGEFQACRQSQWDLELEWILIQELENWRIFEFQLDLYVQISLAVIPSKLLELFFILAKAKMTNKRSIFAFKAG